MIGEGLAIASEKAAEAGVPGAVKAAGTTVAKASGEKTLAAKAMALIPGLPILAVGGLIGIIAWEFWKGSQEAKEMQK